MMHFTKWIIAAGLIISAAGGNLIAQEEEDQGSKVVPVEIYVCDYNDGKGPSDLDNWTGQWNNWADSTGVEPYSAWTLTPFYYGADQDFDFIWLGVAPDAATMGRGYDNWLSNSGSLPADFNAIASCRAHGNFATMNIKQPPDDDATSFVLTFSDCKIADGKTFDDAYPALKSWSEYKTAKGSKAGMWVMWPAFGGGDSDFNFKFVVSHRNYESLGIDYDEFSSAGYAKAEELFGGLLDCDEARAYNARERRDGIPDDA
jgi:hypothetical protein